MDEGIEAPKDLIRWLRDHPHLIIRETASESIGGVLGTGLHLEVRPDSVEEAHLFLMINENRRRHWFSIEVGRRNYVIVLKVGEDSVLIWMESPADKFSALQQKARSVLQTVDWRP